jgi:hypothetical protein
MSLKILSKKWYRIYTLAMIWNRIRKLLGDRYWIHRCLTITVTTNPQHFQGYIFDTIFWTRFSMTCIRSSSGLALWQNKHVLRASRGKGIPQNSIHKAIYFISQILDAGTKVCLCLGHKLALIRPSSGRWFSPPIQLNIVASGVWHHDNPDITPKYLTSW